MGTIVAITDEELRNLPPLSEEEKQILRAAPSTPTDDCPALTPEQLARLRPWYEAHPEWYKTRPKKIDVHIKIDADVLEWYKSKGPRYQTRMNAPFIVINRKWRPFLERWQKQIGCVLPSDVAIIMKHGSPYFQTE